MLVLSRVEGEQIMIGDDITVTVCRVDGAKVKLGISAPQSVLIHRREIWDRIRREHADDPTRQTVTATLNRQEAYLIANHFRLLAANGSDLAHGIVARFDKLLGAGRE